MLNDSVREELALKISPLSKISKAQTNETKTAAKTESVVQKTLVMPVVPPEKNIEISAPPAFKLNNRPQTSEIMTKMTSPTLVEFNNKNAALPDWRLQLQNSVRKRLGTRQTEETETPMVQTAPRRVNNLVTNGATALKAEAEFENEPVTQPNPLLSKALQRISQSRERYLVTETCAEIDTSLPPNIPQNSLKYLPASDREEIISRQVRPNLLQFKAEARDKKFETNKLPPPPTPAKISSSFDKKPIEPKRIEIDIEDDIPDMIQINSDEIHKTNSNGKTVFSENTEKIEQTEEIEDLAPISLRFNSAIFDLLIGSFLSLILLSPFMMLNGRFFSLEGFLAFLATFSIVMFIYLTTTIGFLGRTFGMRIFSLEIVDIVENDYPTLHQAAVSSSVYLLSLAFGGLGFLPMLLNSEKRAAHDLLSKTIILKEY